MLTHDPRKILENFRDHLSQHDTSIAFLFGAGTSCSVNRKMDGGSTVPLIPSVAALTNTCEKKFDLLMGKMAKLDKNLD
jgi:hypothetical protein